MEAPRPNKVKMPSVEMFDGTIDPDDHLDLCKVQMYVQDMDDMTLHKNGSMLSLMGASPPFSS